MMCICKADDSYDCYALRHGLSTDPDDVGELLEAIEEDGGPCSCACHDEDDDE